MSSFDIGIFPRDIMEIILNGNLELSVASYARLKTPIGEDPSSRYPVHEGDGIHRQNDCDFD